MATTLTTSVVVPIAKVEGSANCGNLKPINIFLVTEKISESIVYEILPNHIKEGGLLSKQQPGFRGQHNTETALQLVIVDWLRAIDRGEEVVVVFLDYKRDF